MLNFITCPICSGHEKISAKAAAKLAHMIAERLEGFGEGPVVTELMNIRNIILNTQQRQAEIDPLLE